MKPNKDPKKVAWEDDCFGGKYPVCPVCNELAYFTDKCCFCGQVFEQDDNLLREFNSPVQIERDGYTIVQTSNNHIHIYNPDGTLKSHASCTKKMTAKELEEHLEFVLSL